MGVSTPQMRVSRKHELLTLLPASGGPSQLLQPQDDLGGETQEATAVYELAPVGKSKTHAEKASEEAARQDRRAWARSLEIEARRPEVTSVLLAEVAPFLSTVTRLVPLGLSLCLVS